MSDADYSRTINVAASPEEAYQALTQGFEFWWTTPDQPISKVGDKARFAFPPGQGYWTFQATDLRPGQYVEMVCIDAHHASEGLTNAVEKEWLHGKAEIRFEHRGLTPDLYCYDECVSGWDYFFVDSLKAYLDIGVGKPHRAAERIEIRS